VVSGYYDGFDEPSLFLVDICEKCCASAKSNIHSLIFADVSSLMRAEMKAADSKRLLHLPARAWIADGRMLQAQANERLDFDGKRFTNDGTGKSAPFLYGVYCKTTKL
jgi:hypothetical protein